MYYAYGWFALWLGTTGEDESVREEERAHVRDAVASTNWSGLGVELRTSGPSDTLLIGGEAHHTTNLPEEFDRLLEIVGRCFPGSFGVLHEYSAERDSDTEDNFRVRVMRRGSTSVVPDPFFSPRNPMIED